MQLAGKQLILTSDKPPVELKDIEQRLLTRFKWGLSAYLSVPDYQTKIKIIRAKAQRLGVNIPEDVVTYLAENISANVREIEGALSSLIANASFLGRKITISLAKDILKVYVKLTQREITIDHIREGMLKGMEEQKAEIEAIVNNTEAPTFENTIEAMEYAGGTLTKVAGIFFNVNEANTSDEMQKVAEEITPM